MSETHTVKMCTPPPEETLSEVVGRWIVEIVTRFNVEVAVSPGNKSIVIEVKELAGK